MPTLRLPTKRRQYHKIYAPTAGLIYDVPSTMIAETNTPNCNEVVLREGKVSKSRGTSYFAQTNTYPLNGTVMHLDQYYKSDGSERLVCHTTRDVYVYNTVTNRYNYLTLRHTTGTVSVTNGSAVVTGTGTGWVTAGIKGGDKFGVGNTNPDAITVWYTVQSVDSETQITLTTAYAQSSASGQPYVIRKLYTGDEDNSFSSEIMNDLYIFCNYADNIHKWDMTSGSVALLGGASNYKAKKVLKFGERLCLFHTVEGGTVYPQRVRWSVVANPENWSGAGSGYTDLITVLGVDFLQSAEKLGNYVVVYGERTIALMEYKAEVDEPYLFNTRLSGTGLAAPRALVNLGEEHIFLGWDDIYSYSGGRNVERIGKGIKEELFRLINPEYIHRSFMVYVEEKEEIRLFVPIAGSVIPNCYFIYNLKYENWSRGARSYTGYGYYETKSRPTWNEMTNSWNSFTTTRWDDSSLLALAPINLFGDTSGYVYKDDDLTSNLVGSAIDGWWETKDFVVGEAYIREITNWMELNFEARGNSMKISYSTDLGVSWSSEKVFTLTSAWSLYNYDFEINAPQVRFRFRNNAVGETFELRMFEIGYLPASDRGVK